MINLWSKFKKWVNPSTDYTSDIEVGDIYVNDNDLPMYTRSMEVVKISGEGADKDIMIILARNNFAITVSKLELLESYTYIGGK